MVARIAAALVIPEVMTLATLADVRALMRIRRRITASDPWRHVDKAIAGVNVVVALRLALMSENVECSVR